MPGFIQDKLEIKFLILYIMDRIQEPVPFEIILELAMCDDGVGYFDFSECMANLVTTEHLALSSGLYSITDKGRRNSAICESSLPRSVRLRCDRNVDACNRCLRRKRQVRSTWEKRSNGTYTVHLILDDDMGSILDLKLMVPREDMSKTLAERFQKAPERIYSQIVDVLLDAGEDE